LLSFPLFVGQETKKPMTNFDHERRLFAEPRHSKVTATPLGYLLLWLGKPKSCQISMFFEKTLVGSSLALRSTDKL
jgi:hypothetical protein